MPAKKNTFYDFHMAMVKYSVLHDKGFGELHADL